MKHQARWYRVDHAHPHTKGCFYFKKMSQLPKQYDPKAHEEATYQRWEDSGAFAPNQEALTSGRQPFVIMLPPPNITGTLHMGHALQDTIMDVLIRYHRMQGEPTLWVPGTDHAAIATNKVIEQQLQAEGKTRHDVGREEFLRRTEDWYKKTGEQIIAQMKRLGCSCDWSRTRFTLDDAYYQAVQHAFLEYFKREYIYRGASIVNWDPKAQTTVSDLEIEWQTEKAPLYFLQYGPFEIATARPETKFGDKYVVMHPDDQRYAAYQAGDTFTAEWINGPVLATIVKDASIDPTFGSGVMTITPWHDATDFEIAKRHNLDMEQIIGFDGTLLPSAGEFSGQTISAARSKIVEKLQTKGLLVRVQEEYEHNVAVNDRGKGTIEPQVMRQWFVNMQKLKGETMAVAEQDLVRFLPPRWKKHFLVWMHDVRDWNINRQIWLGHRLPVWWKPGSHGTDHEEGQFKVSITKPEGDWQQDPDVLDTWFSSALWPLATLGWPAATADLKLFYPTSVLVTARDILYLWVARMIFSGLELLTGEEYGKPDQATRIPFKEVFIHPTVLTKTGQRMSKSLGTGIDPLDLIEKYGADATRFGLMFQMSYDNQAIRFDEAAIVAARNFANKLWNIARLLQIVQHDATPTLADAWIVNRSRAVQNEVANLLQAYKVGEAARLLHEFVWSEYADWYLEIYKVGGSLTTARSVWLDILRMLHPFMPHVTEVLWQHFAPAGDGKPELLMTSTWPAANPAKQGLEASPVEAGAAEVDRAMDRFREIVTTVRSARRLLDIPASSTIEVSVSQPVLPAALAALCRARLVDAPTPAMKQIPLPSGQSVSIGSADITPDSLQRIRAKMVAQREKSTAMIERLQSILKGMRTKASAAAIHDKEQALLTAVAHLREIDANLKLLDSY